MFSWEATREEKKKKKIGNQRIITHWFYLSKTKKDYTPGKSEPWLQNRQGKKKAEEPLLTGGSPKENHHWAKLL